MRNHRLKAARAARRLTQADVAKHLGTSVLTVSRWENGTQSPMPYYRERLCQLYGLSAIELGLAIELESLPAQDGAAPRSAEARARYDLLTQVKRYWVGSQLEGAPSPLPSLTLSLVERSGAVDDPLRIEARPEEVDRLLPHGIGIGTVYHKFGEQLLILGEPGVGKTTLLLQLARELLADGRDPAGPMPVVFHLASWATERRPLARWLADELHRRYGVSHRLATRWIESEQILPLLDGLDEVADRHRAACVAAINAFHNAHGQLPMAVCCRTGGYETLPTRLALRGAVSIVPLSQDEVIRYVSEAGDELAGVRALLEADERLGELLTTPLFLSIAAVAYRDGRTVGTSMEGTVADRRRRLIRDYVEAMSRGSHDAAPFTRERTGSWLSWLARTMREHDQSVFYPDQMQPSWLPGRFHRWLVTTGVTVAVGLASGLLVGINWGADWGLSMGPTMFALIGVTVGLQVGLCHGIVAHESRIVPAERLCWSWSALGRGMRRWLGIGLAVGLACGFAFGLVLGVALSIRPDVLTGPRSAGAEAVVGTASLPRLIVTGLLSGLVNGAGLGLTLALTFGLLTGLDPRSGVVVLGPGQSVEASRRNAIAGGIVGGCIFGLAWTLAYGWGTSVTGALVHHAARALGLAGVYWPIAAPNDVVVAALFGAMIAGLQRGGGAYLRHRALMHFLVRDGSAPSDYVGFLEHAARLGLLRRRGGGYEFVHHLVREHFAELD